MQRILCFCFVIFVSLLPSLNVASQENVFQVKQVNFEAPEGWTIIEPIKSRSIYISHKHEIATINIVQRKFIDPITANALHEKRAVSHYDGWIKILTRVGSSKELIQSNAEDSHVAVFIKQFLNNNFNLDEFIVGEYYYIKDNYYTVISISTTKKHWKTIQPDIKTFLSSFWLGNGMRPVYIPKENTQTEWLAQGNRNNNNYIDAKPGVEKALNLEWELSLTKNASISSLPVISKDNTLYLLNNDHLLKVNYETGNVQWKFPVKGTVDANFLAYNSNLLFIIKTAPTTQLLALSADSGELIYSIPIHSSYTTPVFQANKCYINENGIINAYATDSGSLIWSKNHSASLETPIVCAGNTIVLQQENSRIIGIHTKNGKTKWQRDKIKLRFAPASNDTTVFLPTLDDKGRERLIAVDAKNGKRKWGFDKSIMKFSFARAVSVSPDHVIITGHIINNQPTKPDTFSTVLFNIDIDTGSVEWQQPISNAYLRPMLTDSHIFSVHSQTQDILVLDSLTGERVTLLEGMGPATPLNSLFVYHKYLIRIKIQNNKLHFQCFS